PSLSGVRAFVMLIDDSRKITTDLISLFSDQRTCILPCDRPLTTCGVQMFSSRNRIALVTGGGRGIGPAIAIALAQAGAKVGVTARTSAELNEVVQTIIKAGGQAVAIASDLAQKDACPKLMQQAAKTLGAIDILVNNAGIGSSSDPKPVADFND